MERALQRFAVCRVGDGDEAQRTLAQAAAAQVRSAVLGRALLEAGVGMMLIREQHALQGEGNGLLALSTLAQPEFGLFISHLTNRRNDPLIRAFVEAAASVWPAMTPIQAAAGRESLKA